MDAGHELVENHGADALEHLVLLWREIGEVDVDEESVVALGFGGGVTYGLVGERFEHGVEVFPEDAGFGNDFDIRFVDEVSEEGFVELDVGFHQDVLSGLD